MRELWIVDPNVSDWRGHYAGYAQAVHDEIVGRGHRCRVLSNRAISPGLAYGLDARPTFRHGFSDRLSTALPMRLLDVPWANWVFERDLAGALRGQTDAGNLMFAPNVHQRQLLGWAAYFTMLPRTTEPPPATVLMLRWDPHGEVRDAPNLVRRAYVRLGFRALEMAAHRCGIRLATDSERLALDYARTTDLPIAILPIPHTSGDFPTVEVHTGPLRLAYLGGLRMEKGLDAFVTAVEMLARSGRLGAYRVTVQTNLSASDSAESAPLLERLRTLPTPGMRLVDGPLDAADYKRELAMADVVVVPYSSKTYRSRTSGPFVEALAAGKPVIASEGTWMSDQLTRCGAGVTFTDGNSADLARAIIAARESLPALTAKASLDRERWRSTHNPGRFVDALLALGDQVVG